VLEETIQLETLRQKIEDSEYEAGSQSDYLDRGRPTPAQAKKANELISELKRQSQASRAELKQLISTVRSHHPEALEEWVNFHIGILQKVCDEKTMGAEAVARRNLAKGTLQEWERIRAGEMEYVSINWHFLKDYKASARKITSGGAGQEKAESKAWWQFWK
jgi:hypothetical protein